MLLYSVFCAAKIRKKSKLTVSLSFITTRKAISCSMILESPQNWKDYELIDSGNFEKLERFGSFILARPEPKAVWVPSLPAKEWDKLAHTRFTAGAGFGKSGKEDTGTWKMLKKMPEQWYIRYNLPDSFFKLRLGLTSFKHVGVFPEQSPNWEFIYAQSKRLVEKFAAKVPVSRFLVNTPAALGGIGATTGLFPALTLGCGAVGGSSSSNNIGPRDLVNIRRVAWGTEEAQRVPSVDENLVELLAQKILERLN
jgi:hypothetical protein